MLLVDVGLELAVQSITVHWYTPSPPGVRAERDGASVDKLGVWRDIVMPAVTTGTRGEGLDVMFFFQRHVVSSGSHCAAKGGVVMKCSLLSPLLDLCFELGNRENRIIMRGTIGVCHRSTPCSLGLRARRASAAGGGWSLGSGMVMSR